MPEAGVSEPSSALTSVFSPQLLCLSAGFARQHPALPPNPPDKPQQESSARCTPGPCCDQPPLETNRKTEEKRKGNQLSDRQAQSRSRARRAQNSAGRLSLLPLVCGKDTVQVCVLPPAGTPGWGPRGSTAPWFPLSRSLHSCPARPRGPGTPRGATAAPRSLPLPLWAPPRWRGDGP